MDNSFLVYFFGNKVSNYYVFLGIENMKNIFGYGEKGFVLTMKGESGMELVRGE